MSYWCCQVTRHQQSLGALAELWLVFPVYVEVAPTAPVKELSATCAGAAVCLRRPRRGVAGTARSMSISVAMPCVLLLPPRECRLWSCQKVACLAQSCQFSSLPRILKYVFVCLRVTVDGSTTWDGCLTVFLRAPVVTVCNAFIE